MESVTLGSSLDQLRERKAYMLSRADCILFYRPVSSRVAVAIKSFAGALLRFGTATFGRLEMPGRKPGSNHVTIPFH
jgi:hypothetical protein